MSPPRRSRDDEPETVSLNSPFRDLRKLVGDRPLAVKPVSPPPAKSSPPVPRRPSPPAEKDGDETDLFLGAVVGARPLPQLGPKWVNPPRPPLPRPGAREDAEALAALSDLVDGSGHFDVSDSDEHVEGGVVGLDDRVMRKLRTGEFAVQAHFDLHGLKLDEAKPAVRQFLMQALRSGHRCVLIVHGRGHHSPDRRSVLKDELKSWLTRGELAQIVLAFSTARSCDGGNGASYVLLRRQRRPRKPYTAYDGAKR